MSINSTNNSRTKIDDLTRKSEIEDNNLIIVEDDDDTKKSTIHDLKKAFLGDACDPESFKFYSSKMIQKLIEEVSLNIHYKANVKDLDELRKNLANIIANNGNGTKDTEIIDARNGETTLSQRLELDKELADFKYIEKIKKRITGEKLYIEGKGHVDINVIDKIGVDNHRTGYLITKSINFLNYKITNFTCDEGESGWSISDNVNGLVYHSHEPYAVVGDIGFDSAHLTFATRDKGKYNFKFDMIKSDLFEDAINFFIHYSDGTIEKLNYDNNTNDLITFETNKGFNEIEIRVEINKNNHVSTPSARMEIRNIMLISDKYKVPNLYVPFYYTDTTYVIKSETNSINFSETNFYNNNYIYETSPAEQIIVSYYDEEITLEYIYNKIKNINSLLDDKKDKCGLITDYGIYQYLDNMYVSTYEEGVTIENNYEYSRNGIPSKKITITEGATMNSVFRIPLDDPIDTIETVGLFFYMDKTDSSLFTDRTGGLKIRLCSDEIIYSSSNNYYEYLIGKKEIVQGWNFIKKRITDFSSVGNPNPNAIRYIYFEICRNDEMNMKSLYLNSFVFNQKMKPAVILCLNGTYDDSVSYLYPYLQNRNIKATLFLNSKRTLSPETIDYILKYKVKYGWDIGLDGCHPNKEILTSDDNYRNQYIALLNSKNWLRDSMVNSPISYSAAYGNLRPITVPILKDLGFKLAKTDINGFCGFFSNKDFALPSHLISNESTSNSIIDKINYAIESNQSIIIYTNNVTEYGSEIDSKKVTFETIIDYISDKVEEGSIECITLNEFYNRCIF